jgi:hypothetical protein
VVRGGGPSGTVGCVPAPNPNASQARYRRHLEQLAGLALLTGSSLYPSVELALRSLPWLEANSIAVLGFDGFTTDGLHLFSSMHIADFSKMLELRTDWTERVRHSVAASQRVLNEWRGTVQFVDMVIASQAEFEVLRR